MHVTHRITLISLLIIAGCFSLSAQDSTLSWSGYYGGSDKDQANAILELPGGGYILAGQTNSKDGDIQSKSGMSDAWVWRIDTSGKLLWQKCLGFKKNDKAAGLTLGRNGQIAIAGFTTKANNTTPGHHGKDDVYFALLDTSGTVLVQKCFGGSGYEGACAIAPVADGGYILAATTNSSDGDVKVSYGNNDVWLLRIDSSGNLLWQKSFGGTKDDVATSVKETYAGEYVISAYTYSNNGDVTGNKGKYDAWILLVDSLGNSLGQQTYGGLREDIAYDIIPTWDNGFLFAGSSTSAQGDVVNNKGKTDFWIVKLDPGGNVQWKHSLGGKRRDIAKSVVQTYDGGYAVLGYTFSGKQDISHNNGRSDFWIVKLDSLGTLEWEACLGRNTVDIGKCIIATNDWGMAVAGYSEKRRKKLFLTRAAFETGINAGTIFLSMLTIPIDLLTPRKVERDAWVVKF
jgi:hypothetical protein